MRRLITLAILMAAMSGCGSEGAPKDAPSDDPSVVTGVIIDISSKGIEDVESFTVRDEGEIYEIFIADDVDYGFPLGHLNAHRQAAEPVRVTLEVRDGRLYALSIEDA